MGINAMIPLGVQPVKMADPLEQYANVVGIKNAMNQGRLADLQYTQTEKAAKEDEAFKAGLKNAIKPDGTIDESALKSAYFGAGKGADYAKLQESQSGITKNNAQAERAKAETAAAHLTQLGNLAGQANAENWPAIRQQALALNPALAQSLPEQYPGDETVKAWSGIALDSAKKVGMQKDAAEAASQPFNPDGTPNPAAQKFALEKAGMSGTKVAVNLPGKGLEGLQGAQDKVLEESGKTAGAAAQALASINQAREANAKGRYAGSGATAKAAIVDFVGNGLGINIDKSKMSNTRDFASAVGAQLLAHAKSLGANPSNADADRIKDILGSADTDPDAMNKLLDWQEDIARRSIDTHNTRIDQVEQYARANKLPNPFAFDMRVQAPAKWTPQTTSPSSPAAGATYIWDQKKGLMTIQPGR